MPRIRRVEPGQPAPEISAEAWTTPEPVRLRDLRGGPVLLVFFGTDCAPCTAALPLLKQLHANGSTLIGLTRDGLEATRAYASQHEVPWPLGAASLTGKAYGVIELPYAVLIGEDGVTRWTGPPGEAPAPVVRETQA